MVEKVEDCAAYEAAIQVLARPWTGLILSLLLPGPRRYVELREGAPGVGDKVLSARLKELVERGLVDRQVDPGPPVCVSYALTAHGKAFGRARHALEAWGEHVQEAAGRTRGTRR